MNIEEIKVGETYNVRVKVEKLGEEDLECTTIDPYGIRFCTCYFDHKEALAFSPIPAKPKYDPCRKFKKGDVVRIVDWNGRAPIFLKKHIGTIQIVDCDEDSNGVAGIVGDIEAAYAANLKLVTPVEELEPYSIDPETTTDIFKDGEWYAQVCDGDEAEHLCEWLNEKHRKEHEND